MYALETIYRLNSEATFKVKIKDKSQGREFHGDVIRCEEQPDGTVVLVVKPYKVKTFGTRWPS